MKREPKLKIKKIAFPENIPFHLKSRQIWEVGPEQFQVWVICLEGHVHYTSSSVHPIA